MSYSNSREPFVPVTGVDFKGVVTPCLYRSFWDKTFEAVTGFSRKSFQIRRKVLADPRNLSARKYPVNLEGVVLDVQEFNDVDEAFRVYSSYLHLRRRAVPLPEIVGYLETDNKSCVLSNGLFHPSLTDLEKYGSEQVWMAHHRNITAKLRTEEEIRILEESIANQVLSLYKRGLMSGSQLRLFLGQQLSVRYEGDALPRLEENQGRLEIVVGNSRVTVETRLVLQMIQDNNSKSAKRLARLLDKAKAAHCETVVYPSATFDSYNHQAVAEKIRHLNNSGIYLGVLHPYNVVLDTKYPLPAVYFVRLKGVEDKIRPINLDERRSQFNLDEWSPSARQKIEEVVLK